MRYRPRSLETAVRAACGSFGAVLVTGPRQSGKSSLLSHILATDHGDAEGRTVSFDTPSEVGAFRRDPDLFFADRPGVVFLDEVQRVPDLFPYLKRELDIAPGQLRFFLSGSQQFHLMRGISESLAGRVAILDLWPFAVQELKRTDVADTVALLEDPARLDALIGEEYPINDVDDVLPAMLTGGFPPMIVHGAGSIWLESYRRTFIDRDLRDLSQVADLGRFDRFVVLLAGRTGTVVNKAELASVVGVDAKTIDGWLSILSTAYMALRLPPYFENATKRLVKRPKWYFGDVGLALHLQAIRDAEALRAAPHFGHLFESFVVMEIRKLYGHAALPWSGHFWGLPRGAECDLVLPVGGRLVPIEIKHAATLRPEDHRGIRAFRDLYSSRATAGILVSLSPRVEKLAPDVYNLPLGLILRGPGRALTDRSVR